VLGAVWRYCGRRKLGGKTDEEDTRITFTMKIDAARPSETLVRICPITWQYIPEDMPLNIKRHVKLEGGWY
jgi:hypothetical protein